MSASRKAQTPAKDKPNPPKPKPKRPRAKATPAPAAVPPREDHFQPAFCHRTDCAADRNLAYCAQCGADIAAYLKVITDEHEAAVDAPTLVAVPSAPGQARPFGETFTSPPPPGPAIDAADGEDDVAPGEGEQERRVLRDPAVWGAFAVACGVGAAAGIVIGLV